LNNKRKAAIEKLGGLTCRGLSFIGGPDCPVPSKNLLIIDLNFGHKKSRGGANKRYSRQIASDILRMKNPQKKFILLCTLCNQRMRYIAEEWRIRHIPKRAIKMYQQGKTLIELAAVFDCSYSTISKFLKKNGIEIRKSDGGKRAWLYKGTELARERATRHTSLQRLKLAREAADMHNDGDSLREIGEWLGMSKNAIMALLNLSQE
jgi:AraC-like DNA-binding protein